MGLDESFHQAQSEPETALRAAFVTAVEAFPDAGLFGCGNSGARVANADDYPPIPCTA
jgi:hypothetical protein